MATDEFSGVLKADSGATYLIGDVVGIIPEPGTSPCDAHLFGEIATTSPDGQCRCVVCPRCGHHTGNAHQGHWWGWCKVTKTSREPHLCCPDPAVGCELEAAT